MVKKYRKILVFSLVLLSLIIISCSDSNSSSDRKIIKKKNVSEINGTSDMKTDGPVSVKRYEVLAGADPEISAEDGGEGFDKIAESLGFSTNDNFNLEGDPKAKKGGAFTMSFSEYPSTFRTDGRLANSYINHMMMLLIYEPLLELDKETQNYKPALATHWKISEDKKKYTFRIDPNARWNDGKPVVANDVVETWKLLTDESILAPSTNSQFKKYEKPIAESKYIVSVVCKEVDWYLFYNFVKGMTIFPAHHLNKIDGKGYLDKYHWKMLPGSGPYVLDEKNTKNGQQIVLRRRSDFWGKDLKNNIGKNNFDLLKYITIRDEVLEKEKIKTGDIDFYMVGRAQWWVNEFNVENPVPAFDELKKGLVQKRKVFNYKPQGITGIFFNMRKAPFDDKRVRIALAHLWNRDQLIEKLFFNEYNKITSAYPGGVYSNPNNTIYKYDPIRANLLLDEAGWKNRDSKGFRLNSSGEIFEIELKILQSSERIFTPLQADLEKAGIKLSLKISDSNSKFKSGNERRFKIHYQGWTSDFFPNPEHSYHSKFADPDNTNNFSGVKNERIDELCDMYRPMFDQNERVKLIQEIDKLLSDECFVAPGWFSPHSGRLIYWNKFGMPKSFYSYAGDWYGVSSLWWIEPELEKKLEEAKNDPSITMPIGEVNVDFFGKLKKKK